MSKLAIVSVSDKTGIVDFCKQLVALDYRDSFEVLPIFKLLQQLGHIDEMEMYNVFNMGIGMIIIVDKDDVEKTLDILASHNEKSSVIGYVTSEKGVKIL